MSPEQIQSLAQAIADQHFHTKWEFYALWFLVTLVASAAGGWLVAYFKRRGENYATKQDFTDLLQQVEQTTRATTTIKTKIEHMDWAEREWRTLRRQKAEQILKEIHSCRELMKSEGSADALSGESRINPDAAREVTNLTALYFPEHINYSTAFYMATSQVGVTLLGFRKRLLRASLEGDTARLDAKLSAIQSLPEVLRPMSQEAARFEMAICNSMANMAGQPDIYTVTPPPTAQMPSVLDDAAPPV